MKETKLEVWLDDRFVGTMAETNQHKYAFAYSEKWLKPASLSAHPRIL